MTPDLILLEQTDEADLPAGEFSDWLAGMTRALAGQGESDVPCDDCNACCRSSYFIELKPSDADARRRIPAAVLFDAPGAPSGHQVLGYDEAGRCPMLQASGCSVYADRPGSCRTYDCRIFAATGIAEAAPEKADVTARARRWQFNYGSQESRDLHQLLLLGTRVLVEMQAEASDLPRTPTQLALLAVQLCGYFQAQAPLVLGADDEASEAALREGILETVRRLIVAPDR